MSYYGTRKSIRSNVKRFPDADEYKVVLYGSLALTGKGHLTDEIIKKSFAPKNVEIEFDYDTYCSYHSNTMDIHKRRMLLSSLGQITTLLNYKCERYGKELKKIARYYPSSQTCSHCGKTYRVGKSETYRCPRCKLIIDRDYNAAINILNYGKAHNLK